MSGLKQKQESKHIPMNTLLMATSGGFFTGAFVGLAAVDYSGYETEAQFDFFEYKEYGDEADSVK